MKETVVVLIGSYGNVGNAAAGNRHAGSRCPSESCATAGIYAVCIGTIGNVAFLSRGFLRLTAFLRYSTAFFRFGVGAFLNRCTADRLGRFAAFFMFAVLCHFRYTFCAALTGFCGSAFGRFFGRRFLKRLPGLLVSMLIRAISGVLFSRWLCCLSGSVILQKLVAQCIRYGF